MTRRSLMLPAAVSSVVLTTFAVAQVFDRQRWFFPSLLAVGLAFGAGWVARRLDVPGPLAPAISLLGLVTLLGILFVPETTAAGIPTAATMQGLGDLVSLAGTDIRESAPPAPPTDGLTMLATAGIFLVAMVVDTVVFGLRRPVAAGMPLLALYLIPTSMAKHANVFAFVLAAIGYLTLLVAEGRDRARNWGRRLSGMNVTDDVADVSHVARVGRRIGSAAVGVALCVPLAVPTVGQGLFTRNGGWFGSGEGSRTAYVLNPIVQIQSRLKGDAETPIMRVRTTRPEYLRLVALSTFNGEEWGFVNPKAGTGNRVAGDDIPLPDELDDIGRATETYDIDAGLLDVAWLPLPYAPRRVGIGEDGDWRYEADGLSVFSAKKTTLGERFTVEAELPEPTIEQLRAGGEVPDEIRDKYLGTPEQTPAIVQSTLDTVTAGAQTPYDQAVALNEWFHEKGGFRYSVDVAPGNGIDSVEDFLETKVGYCEQFATSMAYLARLANIPSRVIVGFTPGDSSTEVVDEYVITNKHAHAWPELYFPATGWVRFEPTPRTGFTRVPDYARREVQGGEGGGVPTPEPTATPTAPGAVATPSNRPNQRAGADDVGNQDQDPQARQPGAGDGGGVPAMPLAAGVAVVALATPSVVAWGTRRRRRQRAGDHLGRIHAAWDTLADAAEDAGHPMRAADSPRGSARRLVASADLSGPVADAVLRLATAEERARYARSVQPVDGLDAEVRSVRRAMVAALPRAARVRALVFPASALRRIREGLAAANVAVERRRDALNAKITGMFRRGRPREA